MAIVKATYTRQRATAKASVRYIAHRPAQAVAGQPQGQRRRLSGILFGPEGVLSRQQAYAMIDQAPKGSVYFRFALSPDPEHEDRHRDIPPRLLAEQLMKALEEQHHQPIAWAAALHDDPSPHRHLHVLAVVPQRVTAARPQVLRERTKERARHPRRTRDLQLEQQGKEATWDVERSA